MDGEPGMRIAGLAKAGAVAALLLAEPAQAGALEDAACVSAHDWTEKLFEYAGLRNYMQGWRCDVVEDLGDGTWRVAGLYGRRGTKTVEPFVVRLYGPAEGLFGYCDVIAGGRQLGISKPQPTCSEDASGRSAADPPA